MNLDAWRNELADIMPHIIELRRSLHRCPELSGCEEATSRRMVEEMKALGYSIRLYKGSYAVMAEMRNGDGPCVGIRADMDALPIVEKSDLPFRSVRDGVMHACGHDVHMSLAVGSATWFAAHRDRWHGTLKYFFEPSEETIGGGKQMVEEGCLENPKVDVVIGQHVNPRYAPGTFFAKPGYVSGASDELELTVRGCRSHGAYPEGGVDAIVIAAQIITAVQTLVSRTISPFQSAVITIGTIEGGTANNIISGEVRMTGTIRTLNEKTRSLLHSELHRTCEGIAAAMGGSCEVTITPSYGAVYNDDAAYAVIEDAAAEIVGREKIVVREAPSLGVDSFCYYVQDTPGVYYDIGSGISTALHTDTFLVDESCMLPGVAMQIASALGLGLAKEA